MASVDIPTVLVIDCDADYGPDRIRRLTRLWSGREPVPEDLLVQLKDPMQLRQFQGRIHARWFPTGVSENLVIETPTLGIEPITPQRLLDTFGHPAGSFETFETSLRNLADAAQRLLDPDLHPTNDT